MCDHAGTPRSTAIRANIPTPGDRVEGSAMLHSLVHERTLRGRGLSRPMKLDLGIWQGLPRAELRRTNSFMPLRVLSFLEGTADAEAAKAGIEDIVHMWIDSHSGADSGHDEMAFHDETTAQRLLSCVLFAHTLWADHPPTFLEDLMESDGRLLLPEFHSGLNNHGMYQDVALLTYFLWLPASERNVGDIRFAASRLREYSLVAFTEEGVHIEHSPSYHLLIAKSLKAANLLLDALAVEGIETEAHEDLDVVLAKSERYATQLITPTGRYPRYSDTTVTNLDTVENRALYQSREFEDRLPRIKSQSFR